MGGEKWEGTHCLSVVPVSRSVEVMQSPSKISKSHAWETIRSEATVRSKAQSFMLLRNLGQERLVTKIRWLADGGWAKCGGD